jgi:hypothetical protein
MSNYTVITNYLSKDSLTTGNPLKLVKGADLTADFTAVAAAIATKFDGTLVYAPDGTAAQPSFGFTNNAGVGVYNVAGLLGLATGGVARFTISATGNVVINAPASGDTVTATGIANQFAATFQGVNSAGVSRGVQVIAGTTSADFAFLVSNAANSVQLLNVHGDGSLTLGIPTGGAQGPGTINAFGLFVNGVAVATGTGVTTATFTGTLTGMTTTVSGTCTYTKIGTVVTLYIPAMTGTSNTTAMTLTGLPAAIQPVANKRVIIAGVESGSVTNYLADALISGSTITFTLFAGTTPVANNVAFSNATVKGFSTGACITYDVT